jgi:hypothetical protein
MGYRLGDPNYVLGPHCRSCDLSESGRGKLILHRLNLTITSVAGEFDHKGALHLGRQRPGTPVDSIRDRSIPTNYPVRYPLGDCERAVLWHTVKSGV